MMLKVECGTGQLWCPKMLSDKLFITGDIHGNPLTRLSNKNWPIGRKLSKRDVLIICGDFGLLWSKYRTRNEEYKIKWLDNCPWTTCFVDGNHENFSILNNLPKAYKFGGEVGIVGHSIYHLKRGELYQINGRKIITIGGAHSHGREHRQWGVSMWKEEEITDNDIKNAKQSVIKANYDVDYIISHCAPESFARNAIDVNLISYWQPDGSEELLELFKQTSDIKFKKWFFGHYHTDAYDTIHDKWVSVYNRIHET